MTRITVAKEDFRSYMPKKIKDYLRNWLLKEEIDKLTELENKYRETVDLQHQTYRLCEDAHKISAESITRCNVAINELEDCKKLMNSICDVGVGVGFHSDDHSWAVICAHVKIEYLKFVPLAGKDVREIANFLKHFEYSNRAIDSPFGYKDMINDYIMI